MLPAPPCSNPCCAGRCAGAARRAARPLPGRSRCAPRAGPCTATRHLAPHIAGTPAVVGVLARAPAADAGVVDGGAPAQRRRAPGVNVLVSRHSDGRFIGEVVRRFGVAVVHGSTARNGRDRGGAAGAARPARRAGRRRATWSSRPTGRAARAGWRRPGVAQLAALSGVPVLPCAAQTSRRWTLPTWDRMVLPLPFGRGVHRLRRRRSRCRASGAEAALPRDRGGAHRGGRRGRPAVPRDAAASTPPPPRSPRPALRLMLARRLRARQGGRRPPARAAGRSTPRPRPAGPAGLAARRQRGRDHLGAAGAGGARRGARTPRC